MNRIKQRTVIVCLSVLFLGEALASQCQLNTNMSKADEPQPLKPDQVVTATAEKPDFSVTLTSNPSTGYSWYLLRCNERLIQPVKATYLAPDNKNLIGAPGQVHWQFKVTPAGFAVPRVTRVVLAYLRPWQPSEVAKRYTINVVTQSS